jgi:hypothetical protein
MAPSFSRIGRVLIVLLAAAAWPGVAVAGLALQGLAFEDRNDHGLFDGSDVDITGILYDTRSFSTSHSVVVSGGPLRAPDRKCKMTGDCGGFHITAGKSITVASSLLAGIYGGQVTLIADRIQVGSNLTLDGRDGVALQATHDISIGNNVLVQSRGGSANLGRIVINSTLGDVQTGTKFRMTSLYNGSIIAQSGSITLGGNSQLTSSRSDVDLTAMTSLTADTVRARAYAILSFVIFDGPGPISVRESSLGAPKSGVILIRNEGTIDLTGTRFSIPPAVYGQQIIW